MENPTSLETLLIGQPRQFSQLDLEGFTKKFKTKIGFGGYGNVYKGQFTDGVQIAVKVLSGVGEESFMAEVRTMSRAYHGNLVKLLGFCVDANMKALVYEYMEKGSLDKILYENHFQIEWEKLYNIALETAKVLHYLHDGCRIIHHDVKAANVLLDSDLSPKLADFGIARLLNKNVSHVTLTGNRGTPGYAAPETAVPFSPVTYKCDVYSFGMMLFEILGRRRNLRSPNWFPQYVWDKFENRQLNKLIEDCGIREKDRENAEILSMIALWCIQFTPERRPSMSKVVIMLQKDVPVQSPPNPFPSQGMTSHSVTSMSPLREVIPKVYSKASNINERLHEKSVGEKEAIMILKEAVSTSTLTITPQFNNVSIQEEPKENVREVSQVKKAENERLHERSMGEKEALMILKEAALTSTFAITPRFNNVSIQERPEVERMVERRLKVNSRRDARPDVERVEARRLEVERLEVERLEASRLKAERLEEAERRFFSRIRRNS